MLWCLGQGCHLQTLFVKPQHRAVGPVAFTLGCACPMQRATQRASGAAGRFGGSWGPGTEGLAFSADLVLRAGGWLAPS